MLKQNRIFTAFVAIVLALAANAASLNLGFCNGRIASEGISKVGNAKIEAAVILPESLLNEYVGAKVTGIRIGLVTAEGISALEGWVRSSLEADNLDCGSVSAPQAGWNTASLSKGITIDGNPLAVGFAFSQEKGVKCISLVGDNRTDGRWICKNGKWEISKSKGVVSVELIISGDNLPETDLAITSVTGDLMPVAAGTPLNFSVEVLNPANGMIEGFDLRYSIDDGEPITSHSETALNYGDKTSVAFSVRGEALSPDVPHTMVVEAICSGDGRTQNNIRSFKIGTYTQAWERRVLIEEFTTEKCGNCPRAINTLKQCESAGYGDRMNIVAHHSGYNTDWLTQSEDEEYIWFYDPTGENGTFAPAVMLDRTVLENQRFPVNSIGYFDSFEPMLINSLAIPAFVDLSLQTALVDCIINVSVDVKSMPIFEAVSANPRLSVYVIEDNILHHDQAGITSDTFTHSHVFRKCATDVFGSPINIIDNKAHVDLSLPCEPEWQLDNISVVAFVHDHNLADIDNCRVYNSVSAALNSSGIKLTDMDSTGSSEYFSLTGVRIDRPAAGTICIRRAVTKSGIVTVEKVRM